MYSVAWMDWLCRSRVLTYLGGLCISIPALIESSANLPLPSVDFKIQVFSFLKPAAGSRVARAVCTFHSCASGSVTVLTLAFFGDLLS